jgi:nitrite reductase/ring-hydroxylating ferredoxin subunit
MFIAAKVSEIPNWGKKVVTINGREILLVNLKGNIYACENECPHQGSPLVGALLKDAEHISCPRHGYRFNLKTGACGDFPEYVLNVYPVEVRGDEIMIGID